MSFAIAFATILLSVSTALASPVLEATRDIFSPTILEPNAATVWQLGGTFDVVWDTSNAPQNISNRGLILLRNAAPLAEGFDLRTGRQPVVVPSNLTPGPAYSIILFGDSGNVSEDFTIAA
ncbi:hypothetical protein AURDEDRAFT_64482 [Auricularia subglabra TFB-10046 SS5]|nr:hypothetical protein AURDEDRAFT_64482 [Auricularia subglabra TFB-10046 SS5]